MQETLEFLSHGWTDLLARPRGPYGLRFVLQPLMAGLAVQPNVEQQIAMLSRTLISRPNVEKLVRMADLDLGLKSPGEKEALIDRKAVSYFEAQVQEADGSWRYVQLGVKPGTVSR